MKNGHKTHWEGYETLTEQDMTDIIWNLENYADLWFVMADRRREQPGMLHSLDGGQFDWVMGLAAKLQHQVDLLVETKEKV